MSSVALKWLGRMAVALVWLYQGLWCKLLGGCPSHVAVVASLPAPFGAIARFLLVTIGGIEVMFAFWVLLGWRPKTAAAAQTILLLAMNVGGLLWARAAIAEPVGMVLQNVVFLTLVWVIATGEEHLRP